MLTPGGKEMDPWSKALLWFFGLAILGILAASVLDCGRALLTR
jgi:hypothetical protein